MKCVINMNTNWTFIYITFTFICLCIKQNSDLQNNCHRPVNEKTSIDKMYN